MFSSYYFYIYATEHEELAEMNSSGRDNVSLGDLAWITLKQICSQEWVRDICLQVSGLIKCVYSVFLKRV